MIVDKAKIDATCNDLVRLAMLLQNNVSEIGARVCMDAAEILDTFMENHDWEQNPQFFTDDTLDA